MKDTWLSRWFQRLWPDALLMAAVPEARRAEVRDAVTRTGKWEQHVEWRISTVTSSRIERTTEPGYRKYRVRVECDYEFEARCPTLSRATEVAYMYEQLIPRLWQRYGWPSWASRSQLEATDDTA